jgi:hypothetical protein
MPIRPLAAAAALCLLLACQGESRAGPPGDPAACPALSRIRILASVDGSKADADWPRFVRKGQQLTLHALVEATLDGRKRTFGDAPGHDLSPPDQWPANCPVEIRWHKVEAEPQSYNNAYSAPPATIEAAETEWKNGWSVPADVHPTRMHDEYPDVPHGYGTMRYKATATTAAGSLATPGIDCRRDGALCPEIPLVAWRPDDTYLGYLHELFNTPYIYGSKRIRGGHQTDLLVGSDCADLTVYGKRRQRGRKHFGYTYTGGLYKLASKRTPVHLDDEGFYVDRKNRRLTFSDEGQVRPGDLLNLEEGHVGVLVRDDGDGYLDTGDLLLHTLFREPEIVPIKDCRWGGIDGKEVLRLKK